MISISHTCVCVCECVNDLGDHLTHWDRVTHICVSELTIIGSDNGLSPGRRQAIIWTNDGILLIEHSGTNFSEILIGIQTFSFKKMHLKMSSAKWRPFCLGLIVLRGANAGVIIWCNIPAVIICWWCGYFCRISRKASRTDKQIVYVLYGMEITFEHWKISNLGIQERIKWCTRWLVLWWQPYKNNEQNFLPGPGILFQRFFFKNSQATLADQASKALFQLHKTLHKFKNVPVSLTLDLFDTFISPILNYASEVWGFHSAPEIERIHITVCMNIPGVKKTTQNDFVYELLGGHPLQIDRYCKIMKYWLKILYGAKPFYVNTVYHASKLRANLDSSYNWASKVKTNW